MPAAEMCVNQNFTDNFKKDTHELYPPAVLKGEREHFSGLSSSVVYKKVKDLSLFENWADGAKEYFSGLCFSDASQGGRRCLAYGGNSILPQRFIALCFEAYLTELLLKQN
ncbi:hypothetical protein AVEN_170469-1 [Araneus ventricosus]|uniref:Uncharacterized protein n=1 Tax=Araneus ventricosus TaxID=182803 RepID=A0A4Y2BZV3_ARAVE|nr:hypothetical protein AVEN_170469-1 [Araneus ventricosus]